MNDDLLRIGYAPSTLPTSRDYTSRDYSAILDHLIEVVRTRIAEWTGEDENDFGLALLEAVAYMGDLMSYYIDRAGNESFLETATRRQSVLNLSQMLGYTPTRSVAATGTVTFTTDPAYTGDPVTVPAQTSVVARILAEDGTTTSVQFTTDAEATVDPEGSGADVAVTQGYIADSAETSNHGVLLGTSDGQPDQYFDLPLTPAAEQGLEIWTYDGVRYTQWQNVDLLGDYNAESNVYESLLLDDGTVRIVFGDSAAGRIPPTNVQVSAKYRVGGGVVGNVPANTITIIDNALIDVNLNVTNSSPTSGGSDEESTYSIRENAGSSFRANRRAVSSQDIESIAVSTTGCAKASVNANVWSNITLAVAPMYDGTPFPGLTPSEPVPDTVSTPEVANLATVKQAVKTQLEPLLMVGSSLTVTGPIYPRVAVSITVDVIESTPRDLAESGIRFALFDGPLAFWRRGFGGKITLGDIITSVVQGTSYITDITVDDLYRLDSGYTSGVHPVEADWNEILTALPDDVVIEINGGI